MIKTKENADNILAEEIEGNKGWSDPDIVSQNGWSACAQVA
jgi:hypothetical protein